MEHVAEYNAAVTKLKMILDGEGGGAGGGDNFSSMTPRFNLTRKDSVRSRDGNKRWGSHEDLLHHSTHTKGELREMVTYQEDYIHQLENELSFCRNQLTETIEKVRETTMTQQKETQGILDKVRAENESLKQQLGSKYENLKRDNVWLVNAVQGLKEETMELQKRETEAVEQVRQSVHVAEQISMEKSQLEMELTQVKQQLDRQQERIKSMIEEHLDKIDEVRKVTEQRCRDEYTAIREQADQNAGQMAELSTELERSHRKETDLKKQLNEIRHMNDKVQEDYDSRIGQLQMEMVHLRTIKQHLEHELGCLRVDHDHLKSDMEALEARHRNEVESYRTRLKKTEQLLEENRNDFFSVTEAKTQLEREVNLLRLTQTKPLNNLQDNGDSENANHLRTVVQKQRHIIDELRNQCTDLASKLESISTSYSDQVSKLSHQLGESISQIQILDGQAKQYGQMYEQCCRKIQTLEKDKAQLEDEMESMIRGKSVPKRRNLYNEAIVIEQI